MDRAPIKELIEVALEKPETCISLLQAIKQPVKTVSTYHFTPDIREYFEGILEKVRTGVGGGYWVQAEYGAGKTHFLATLTCLLTDTSGALWANVRDEEVKNYRHGLENVKLFPVVFTLKGNAGVDEGDNLLKVIEDVIQDNLEEKEDLKEKVSITTEDEIIQWYRGCQPGLRAPMDDFIHGIAHTDPTNLSRKELARLITKYCQDNKIHPETTATTKDRLSHIYHQIKDQGYQGLLFVIDEFEAWQRRHPVDSPAHAYDEEVLETLSWILPRDLDLEIFTIVASQMNAPAKLRGGEKDRFASHVLLGKERDYDVIVANRVRQLIKEKQPEISQYYEYYYREFKFLRSVSKDYFHFIFPFQPRVFEVIRKITARELPTARLGISVIHDVISDSGVLSRNSLVTVGDLMVSEDFLEAMETVPYRDSYKAYQEAIEGLDDFELDKEDKDLAVRIIKTLFLWHIAYLETPRPLSVHDLTEATLTFGDVVSGEDNVLRVLSNIRDLPQVYYTKEKGVIFKVTEREIRPAQIFGIIKKKVKDEYEIKTKWEKGLILNLQETEGIGEGLFSGFDFDARKTVSVECQRLEYPGEVILARNWREEYGSKLDELHFRAVFLTKAMDFDPQDLEDSRIAVCVPSNLTNSATEAARDHLAVSRMEEIYASQTGSEAEEVKEWIKSKKRGIISSLLSKQIGLYRDGRVFTKQEIGIDSKEVFSVNKVDGILEKLIPPILSNVYSTPLIDTASFRKKFTGSEARKLFEGLFKGVKSSSATSACTNFATGLRLAKPDNPIEFNPEGNKVFEILRKKLTQSDEIHLWKLYRELQNLGLTKEIVTLNLLAFVYYRRPPAEISLKPMNRLSLSGDKINSFNLRQVEWKARFEQDFDILAPSGEIAWEEVLPLGRIVNPNLRVASRPEQIRQQEQQLVRSCEEIKERIPQVKKNLRILGEKFGQPIKEENFKILENTEKLTSINAYPDFYLLFKDLYEDEERFKSDFAAFKKMKTLAEQSTELLSIKSYLDGVSLGEQERLFMDKVTLEQRISIPTLLSNPSLLGSIRDQFEKFRSAYQIRYQQFHRDYFEEIARLKKELESAQLKIKAINRLSKISELQFPKEEELSAKYGDLLREIQPCSNEDPVAVEATPVCPTCGLKLTQSLPTKEVEEFLSYVDRTLETRCRQLAQALTEQILKEDKERKLDQLVKVANISDLTKLATILDDNLVNLITDVLKKANVRMEAYPVLENIGKRYGLIEEERIEEVVNAFRQELKRAFEEAKKRYVGKKVKISLR